MTQIYDFLNPVFLYLINVNYNCLKLNLVVIDDRTTVIWNTADLTFLCPKMTPLYGIVEWSFYNILAQSKLLFQYQLLYISFLHVFLVNVFREKYLGFFSFETIILLTTYYMFFFKMCNWEIYSVHSSFMFYTLFKHKLSPSQFYIEYILHW